MRSEIEKLRYSEYHDEDRTASGIISVLMS